MFLLFDQGNPIARNNGQKSRNIQMKTQFSLPCVPLFRFSPLKTLSLFSQPLVTRKHSWIIVVRLKAFGKMAVLLLFDHFKWVKYQHSLNSGVRFNRNRLFLINCDVCHRCCLKIFVVNNWCYWVVSVDCRVEAQMVVPSTYVSCAAIAVSKLNLYFSKLPLDISIDSNKLLRKEMSNVA